MLFIKDFQLYNTINNNGQYLNCIVFYVLHFLYPVQSYEENNRENMNDYKPLVDKCGERRYDITDRAFKLARWRSGEP